jgi:transcriptional regulator with XRE-family HTH domain
MSDVGKRIRMLRHQNNWSQQDVAKKLNISIPAFSKIESGVTDVNLSRLEQIAALFNLSVIDLLIDGATNPNILLANQVEHLSGLLRDREGEVIALQKRIIQLFEELKHKQARA